jgi:hypothetical protein
MTGALAQRSFRDVISSRLEPIVERQRPAIEQYALDPFKHFNEGHVVFLDLETLEEIKPDAMWPHQEEIISAWVDLDYLAKTRKLRFHNVHEEKSRQMGITWGTAYACWWTLAYHEIPGLALSLKSAEVDDGGRASTVDSFFGKIRFINERMPTAFRVDLSWRQAPENVVQRRGASQAFLVGEGATPDPGRGGRYGYVFLDEAARIPWSESVHAAVSRACPSGRFYNSTPAGEDNVYYRLRHTRNPEYRYLRHHWSRHPTYSRGLHVAAVPEFDAKGIRHDQPVQPNAEAAAEAERCLLCLATRDGARWTRTDPVAHRYPGRLTSHWYERAIQDLTDEQVASELDIDYTRSLPARVYSEFSEEIHVSEESIPFEQNLGLQLSFDYGLDMTAVGIWQETPNEFRKIAEFEGPDLVPEEVVAGIKDALRRKHLRAEELHPDITPSWFCVGDPAGEARETGTGRPVIADYAKLGISINSRPQRVTRTINSLKRLLMGIPKRLVISGPDCPQTIAHFKANKWPTDRNGKRKPNASAPENDLHNHMMRADAYLVTYKWPAPDVGEVIHDATRDLPTGEGKIDPEIRYGMRL